MSVASCNNIHRNNQCFRASKGRNDLKQWYFNCKYVCVLSILWCYSTLVDVNDILLICTYHCGKRLNKIGMCLVTNSLQFQWSKKYNSWHAVELFSNIHRRLYKCLAADTEQVVRNLMLCNGDLQNDSLKFKNIPCTSAIYLSTHSVPFPINNNIQKIVQVLLRCCGNVRALLEHWTWALRTRTGLVYVAIDLYWIGTIW